MAPPSPFVSSSSLSSSASSTRKFSLDVAYTITLNNTAASLIKKGHHDKAIGLLQQALRLSEFHILNQNEAGEKRSYCMCSECTLDGCIAFSEERFRPLILNRRSTKTYRDVGSSTSSHTNRYHSSTKRRKITQQESSSGCLDILYKEDGNGYIYQHPILIPNDHEMDSTRFFVILFNIALAHHLKAFEKDSQKLDLNRKTLMIYELIFEYLSRLQTASNFIGLVQDDEDTPRGRSLRFAMIIYNNMSELYRRVNDMLRYQQCLESLLSIMMIVVDSKLRNSGSEFAPQEWTTIHRANHTMNTGYEDNERDPFQDSFDGFLANIGVSALSEEQCACAA